jgi:hypothetical protein
MTDHVAEAFRHPGGIETSDEFLQRSEQILKLFRDAGRRPRQPPQSSAPLPLAPPNREPEPYPIAALGHMLADAAQSISNRCQCAPALAAQSTLAAASLAAQRLADVRLPYGQTRPLSLFLLSVAASGERKSTADNEALIPVRMHEKNLRRDYLPLHEAWRVSHAAWAAEHRRIEAHRKLDRRSREDALSRLGPAPTEPVRPCSLRPSQPLKLSRGIGRRCRDLSGCSVLKAAS